MTHEQEFLHEDLRCLFEAIDGVALEVAFLTSLDCNDRPTLGASRSSWRSVGLFSPECV